MDEPRYSNESFGSDDVSTRPLSLITDEDDDPEMSRFESMPLEELNAELLEHGINAEETIAAVLAIIEKRRSLHLQRYVALTYVALAVAEAKRRDLLFTSRPWNIGRAAPERLP
jgi:hypothetical protein